MANEPPPPPEEEGRSESAELPEEARERPLFLHPQWMVGVVLVFAVVAIIAGFENPVWWLIGAPCILTLVVWLWVRLFHPR
jgi:hypothetical protein